VLHALRKTVRELRYWTEFAAPILDDPVRALSVALKEACDGLGTVHDADVHMERVHRKGKAFVALHRIMKQRRRRGLAQFSKCWKPLCRKSCRRVLRAFLEERLE